MRIRIYLFLCILVAVQLAACSVPRSLDPDSESQDALMQYQTVSALLTETAENNMVFTPSPVETQQTPSPVRVTSTITVEAATLEETLTTPIPNSSSTPTSRCDLAQAGRPIDVTIPDDTHLYPGQYFSKTWRLVNAGSCVWDSGYAAAWFSGYDLGVSHSQTFNTRVLPGNSVDVTVEMVAPMSPDTYQSNWKLRNDQDQYFGIGPNGDSPFWVRIVVIPFDTPTFTPLPPTPTQTPVVFASGAVVLSLGEGVDLDTGEINQLENNDLSYVLMDEEQAHLVPGNGALLLNYGLVTPYMAGCGLTPADNLPIRLDVLQTGSYLCYSTTQGHPGRIYLSGLDEETGKINLEFVTWVTP